MASCRIEVLLKSYFVKCLPDAPFQCLGRLGFEDVASQHSTEFLCKVGHLFDLGMLDFGPSIRRLWTCMGGFSYDLSHARFPTVHLPVEIRELRKVRRKLGNAKEAT